MKPPEDPIILEGIIKNFKEMSWDQYLGVIGTYLFLLLVIIPNFSSEQIIQAQPVIEDGTVLHQFEKLNSPYITASVGLILALVVYFIFPLIVSILEALVGLFGFFYHIEPLQNDLSVNIVLGFLGSMFMTIHAIKTIIQRSANKKINKDT